MDDDGAAVLDNTTEVKEEDNQHYEEEKYKPQQNENFQQGGFVRGGSVGGGFQPHPSRVPGAKVPPGPPPGLPPSHSPQQRFQQRQQQQHQQSLGQKRPAEQVRKLRVLESFSLTRLSFLYLKIQLFLVINMITLLPCWQAPPVI